MVFRVLRRSIIAPDRGGGASGPDKTIVTTAVSRSNVYRIQELNSPVVTLGARAGTAFCREVAGNFVKASPSPTLPDINPNAASPILSFVQVEHLAFSPLQRPWHRHSARGWTVGGRKDTEA